MVWPFLKQTIVYVHNEMIFLGFEAVLGVGPVYFIEVCFIQCASHTNSYFRAQCSNPFPLVICLHLGALPHSRPPCNHSGNNFKGADLCF